MRAISSVALDRIVRVLVASAFLFNVVGLSTAGAQAAEAPQSVPLASLTETSTVPPTTPDTPVVPDTALATETPTTTVTSTDTPTEMPTPTATASVTLTSTVEVTPTATVTPPPGDEAVADIDPATGGELVSKDGRVKVRFPAGAVGQRVRASHRPVVPPGQAKQQGIALYGAFELAVTLREGVRLDTFQRPVTLTVDITGLMDFPLPRGQGLWLGYYDTQADGWIRTPFKGGQDDSGKVFLQVETDHFSTWGFGRTLDAGWLPMFNEPQVALFSGAATVNYPIDVPPGRGGVQPQLNLSYNSRQVDGVLSWTQGGWVGQGWDVDMPSITRDIGDPSVPDPEGAPCTDRFHLQINGAGYLLMNSGITTTIGSTTGVRYYTQEDSPLYIVRSNKGLGGGSSSNVTGEYWLVIDPSGVTYRFGYTEVSELVLRPANCDYDHPLWGTYGGQNRGNGDGYAAFMWRVDAVWDANGNQMTVTYEEEDYPWDPPTCSYWRERSGSEKASYLSSISYNGGLTQINFTRATRPGGYDGHGACHKFFHQNQFLDTIEVKQGGSLVRKYKLDYTLQINDNSPTGPSTRLLGSIQMFGSNGTSALPATTFTYTYPTGDQGANRGWDSRCVDPNDPYWHGGGGNYSYDCEIFAYERLSAVDNGYGGHTVFSYTHDGRGGFWTFYNYRVTLREVYDGLNDAPARYEYSYSAPCYNQTTQYWGTLSDNHDCPALLPALPTGALAGYGSVVVTAKDYGGSVLSIVTHYFRTTESGSRLVGQEYQTDYKDPAGNLLRSTYQDYGQVDLGGRWAVRLNGQFERVPNGSGGDQTTRVSYDYDGYGNVTSEFQYGSDSVVLNAGFETSLESWNWNPFWSPTPASLTAAQHFSGQYSLQLQGATGGGAYQDVYNLTPNVTYRVRAWVKATSGTTAQIRFWFHDGNGGNTVYGPAITPGTTWSLITYDYTANSTGKLRIHLRYIEGAGIIYADEVAVARVQDVGDERSTYRFYLPPLTPPNNQWLPGLVWAENVFATLTPNVADYDLLKTQTFYYYDDETHDVAKSGWSNVPITRGRVTMVGRGYLIHPPDPYIVTKYKYDEWGNRWWEADPDGNVTQTTFDGTLHLYPIQQIQAVGRPEQQTQTLDYDWVMGLPVTSTDANGVSTYYRYDTFGRLTKVIRPDDSDAAPTIRYEYRDPAYPILLAPNGGFEASTPWIYYDSAVRHYDYANFTTAQARSASRSLTFTSPGGDRWVGTNVSDWKVGATYQVSAWVMGGGLVCLKYYAGGPGGEVPVGSCVTANANWQQIQGTVTVPAGATEFLIFFRTQAPNTVYVDDVRVGDPLEIRKEIKDTSGALWSRQVFDGLGRAVQVQSEKDGNQAVVVSRRYDSRGLVVHQTVPVELTGSSTGNWFAPYAPGTIPTTLTQYDALGRAVLVTNPDGTTVRTAYAGRQTGVLDANGHQHVSEVDAFGRVVTVKEYSETLLAVNFSLTPYATTTYAYNVLDQLVDVWDAASPRNNTHITYDTLGRKKDMTDPDMGYWTYGYDTAGNLTQQTDARNQVLCFEYDALNRLTKKWQTGCATGTLLASYGYDSIANGNYGKGHRTSITDPSGTTSWIYDNRGRVITETKTIIGVAGTFSTGLGYDTMDRVITTTYPTSEVITQTYNNQGLLENVRSTNASQSYDQWYASNLDYDEAGRLTALALGNGLQTQYNYFPWTTANGQGRLQQIQTGSLQNLQYSYDAVGNVRTITDGTTGQPTSGQVQNFSYDALDRLINAWTTGGTTGQYNHTYQYNAIGNITNTTTLSNYTYNASASGCSTSQSVKPHAVSAAGSNSYQYDCNGNMATRTEGTTSYAQNFDVENRLTSVTVNGQTTTFVYDGDGNRVKKVDNTGTTVYVGNLVEIFIPAPTAMPTPTNTPTATSTATPTNTPSATPTPGGGAITVNTFTDELTTNGTCSLREAIRAANLNTAVDACPAGGSAPVINVPAGTYTLSLGPVGDDAALRGDLDITRTVTLNGAGADLTIISGDTGWSDRIFHVFAAGVQISGVTIRNGNSGTWSGGGIRNESAAALTLSSVTVMSNTTAANGGGIYSTGALTVTNSAMLTNTATITSTGGGGGFYINTGGTATLTNVTISGNAAKYDGGGIRNLGTLTLNNVTLTNNMADSDGDNAGDGGGVRRANGTVNVKNTLIAGNFDNSSSPQNPDCSGTFASQGYNLIGNDTGCTGFTNGVNGDQVGTGGSPLNPQLGPLANNGGPTLTHALLTGSPAIDTGTNNGCPATDQRGYARDAQCDIGAYEYGVSGAAGGAILSAAPDDEQAPIQLASFSTSTDTYPRVLSDAPTALVRPLLSGPTGNETWKVYYYAGAQLIAMRVLTGTTGNTLYYLHSDHLGSTSLTTDVNGAIVARQYYYPYGEVRAGDDLPTDIGFTGQRAESSGLGSLMFFRARFYSPLVGRFLSADTIVPEPGNPQSLNRYSYSLSNPLKYTDPSGHCPICYGLVALGVAYLTARVGWEVAMNVPVLAQATRDVLGGALVTDVSEVITAQAAQQSVDPTLVAAVLRLESPAGERRIWTLVPMSQPGALSDLAETIEATIRRDGTASIGPGQMQLRRARDLEALGYVTPRSSDSERIKALLGKETSVEYVAGMLHYMSDQLNTLSGFNALSQENQQRLILLGYNWGWTQSFRDELARLGYEKFIEEYDYDNKTLDDYLRWVQQQSGP